MQVNQNLHSDLSATDTSVIDAVLYILWCLPTSLSFSFFFSFPWHLYAFNSMAAPILLCNFHHHIIFLNLWEKRKAWKGNEKKQRGKESLGKNESGRELGLQAPLLSKGKTRAAVDFYFSFTLGNFFSHFEIKFVFHLFLKEETCPFSEYKKEFLCHLFQQT